MARALKQARQEELFPLIVFNRKFYFDERQVYNQILRKEFCFSDDLPNSVRSSFNTCMVKRISNDGTKHGHKAVFCACSHKQKSFNRVVLERHANTFSDGILDLCEHHLPYFMKA